MEDAEKHFVGKVAQKAIIEKDGKILVARGIGNLVWEFPGGRLHIDEEPSDGIRREILEELHLPIIVQEPIHICRSLHTKNNTWCIFIAYHCSVDGHHELIIDPQEVEETKGVSREELKTLPMFDDCRETADVFLSKRS